MKTILRLLVLIFLFSSCKKEGNNDFIWEKSLGQGDALFIRSTTDSGFVSCGEKEGKPYLVSFSKNLKVAADISMDIDGLFSSAWSDKSGYIAAGNTGGKMLLARFSRSGINLRDTVITAGFKVDRTTLCYKGNGNMLAVGTAIPDSADTGATGLLFVSLDTTGRITGKKEITETNFVSANKAVVDDAGFIYLSVTRKAATTKSKASVARFNSDIQKIWETELYNNPNFGAATIDIILDASGNIYVTGRTELNSAEGILNNSFIASLAATGAVRWKQYRESINEGVALVLSDADILMMLNNNCFVVNTASAMDGTDLGNMLVFVGCEPETTDAFGRDIDFNYDGNILIAGSKGGSFFLALKSSSQ